MVQIKRKARFILPALLAFAALAFTGCAAINALITNKPVADAGPDQSVTAGTKVTLDGTASTNAPTTWLWQVLDQPVGSSVTISNKTRSIATFTPLVAGAYTIQLTATNDGGSSTATLVVTVSAAAAPAAPTGLSVVGTPSSSSITISWTASATSGVSQYKVYRSASSTGTFALEGITSSTNFQDFGLSAGTPYYYAVSALVATTEGAQSGYILATTATAGSGTVPTAPTGLAISVTSPPTPSTITLTWTAVSGAVGYNVFSSTVSTGPFYPVANGTTLTTTFTDKGLSDSTTYYYVVSAYNSAGEGPQTAPAVMGATTAATGANLVTTPVGLAVSGTPTESGNYPGTYEVTLTWTPVAGASGYYIYVNDAGNDFAGYTDWLGVYDGTAGTATFDYVTAGADNYFFITAFNSDYTESDPSAGLKVTTAALAPQTGNPGTITVQ